MLFVNKKILFVFLIGNSLYGIDLNQVVKAFQHFGLLQDKLVFYFKNDPMVELVSKKVNDLGFCQETFAFPKAQLLNSDELNDKIEAINSFKHPFYRIKISQEDSIIHVTISYDTKYVKKLEVMEFNAISLFKGLTFNIVHDDAKSFFKFAKLPKGKLINMDKPVVVVDMGHGGHDSGAISARGQTEKEVTYKVGTKLKRLLNAANYNVFLTRSCDKFIPLDDRTSGANFVSSLIDNNLIIFVSIHANHSLNKEAKGLETYVPSYSLLNKFSFEKDNLIIQPVYNESMDDTNHKLGSVMHENLLKVIRQSNDALVDRKLKKSISQVLLGSEMPTVLIELGFLSNKEEAELLSSAKYQSVLAQGIFQGICKYFES